MKNDISRDKDLFGGDIIQSISFNPSRITKEDANPGTRLEFCTMC